MDIAPIKGKRDYRRALKDIEELMSAKRNTPEGDRLDVLATLVEAWEARHFPLDLPDPVEAIRYHMEQKGLAPRDLAPFIGGRNRVYEILNRKRPLTLRMIRRLHKGLGIPAESLIAMDEDRAAPAGSTTSAGGKARDEQSRQAASGRRPGNRDAAFQSDRARDLHDR